MLDIEGSPVIFFHTRIVTRELLIKAIKNNKSIELDISTAEDGTYYIGHHALYYEFHGKKPPHNISIGEAMELIIPSDVFVKFDCKDFGAISKVKDLVRERGNNGRCMLHAFIRELSFKPFPKEIKEQPHWVYENLLLANMLELKRDCGDIPLEVSCRGLTSEKLIDKRSAVLEKILMLLKGKVEIVNLELYGNENPSEDVIRELYENGLFTEVKVDSLDVPITAPYYGLTDNINRASEF